MERDTRSSLFGSFFGYFIAHSTIANLVLVLVIVLGFFSISKLRSQFFPDVVIETISVSVNWSGAGAEDLDSGVIGYLEPSLLELEGIEKIVSRSYEGVSRITIDFASNWDMNKALDDVKLAIEEAQNLPDDIDEINVKRRVWRDRVTNIVFSGPFTVEQLEKYSEEFLQLLYSEGVTKTSIRGGMEPIVRVVVPEISLVKNNLTLRELSNAVSTGASSRPAGETNDGLARLKAGSEKRRQVDLAEITAKTSSIGESIKLGDISVISIDETPTVEFFKGNNPAIITRVDRGPEGDAIEIQEKVETLIEEFQLNMPETLTIELSGTRTEAIKNRLNILISNGVVGLILVLFFLFLFLNAETALWVAVGIPAALFASFGLMYLIGISINMISLFALIICLGIVVDDAIVVAEHADYRFSSLKEDPYNAAKNAATFMGLPVFTATITTILAFSGLVLIGGRFGSLIADIPYTVILVLLASLLECFIILPNHMFHSLKNSAKRIRWYNAPSRKFNEKFEVFKNRYFRNFIKQNLQYRYLSLVFMLSLLFCSISLLVSGDVKWRFWNPPEIGRLTANIAMVSGAERNDTLVMLRELERANKKVSEAFEKENGRNPITFQISQVGGNEGRGIAGAENKDKDLLGSFTIELIDADLRPYSSFTYLAALQDEVNKSPLLETISFRRWGSGPGGDGISINLAASDTQNLKEAAEQLKASLAPYEEISALEDTQGYDKTEYIVTLTDRGKKLGYTIDSVGKQLSDRLNGIEAVTFLKGNKTGKIIMELAKEDLKGDFIYNAKVRSTDGHYGSLSDIVEIKAQYGFSSVTREDGQKIITVTGQLSEEDAEQAELVKERITNEILPAIEEGFGVVSSVTGLAEQERRFLNEALIAFLLCVLGIYLTLAWVFASWSRPMVIMLIIPFGLIGALWGHYFYGIALSMFSIIGLIGMTGIIINDSIVLISTFNEYKKKMDNIGAIIKATCDRLRPILLTTLTTVFGLAPLLFEQSRDAQFLKPTVITLVFGLGFGMLILLIIVPVFIAVQHDVYKYYKSFTRFVVSAKLNRQNGWKNLIYFSTFLLGVMALIFTQVIFSFEYFFIFFTAFVCLGLFYIWYMFIKQIQDRVFSFRKPTL
ncbi:efflux RND transporter permease subunit [Paracoccaceae bacterium]|nr:efflux RND transporter permease subunit [Paracoccaceae bacterium]